MTDEQKKLFSLLKIFSELCEENGLRYFLAGGTLLGAVRHQGFIPWDDDIDVLMPEEDCRRFMKLELPEGLAIQSEATDTEYPYLFLKLCDTKQAFKTAFRRGPIGVFIDIFPLVPAAAPGRTAVLRFNTLCVLTYVLQVKCGWVNYIPYKKAAARSLYRVLDTLPAGSLRRIRRRLAESLSERGTGYFFSPGGMHKGAAEFYPESWFSEPCPVVFEKCTFPAPLGWDAYLKQLYGDYMVLPDAAHRYSHSNLS